MANDKSPKVVPFGKYKGQPVEALAQDREYADWLMGQAWFRERYANYYTLIVNNFAEPAETPDHNAMQAEWLEPELQHGFLREWSASYREWGRERPGEECEVSARFEVNGWDVVLNDHSGMETLIEIKPSMGDEYPAVLRQIKARGRRSWNQCFLIIREYTGTGASLEQVKKIFAASGIMVVLRSEIPF